jgi:hypothetical protein
MRNRLTSLVLRSFQSSVNQIPIRGCPSLLHHANPNPPVLLSKYRYSSVNPVTMSSQTRHYCSSSRDNHLPELMEFPHISLPKISYSLKNKLLGATLIRPYFDKEFSIKDFSQGAKFAAVKISQSLSSGDIDELNGLCTPECIDEVTKNLSLFSLKQRRELDLQEDDMFFSFLYQMGILMDDEPNAAGDYGRQVECTWVAHAFRNYNDILEEMNGNPMKIKEVMDAEGGPTVMNFRFIRDFTKNVEDSWTVNALNYYKIMDL